MPTRDLHEVTIAELAIQYPQAIKVLDRYELDYYCHGWVPFDDACKAQRLSPDRIWEEIERELPIPEGNRNHRFAAWDVKMLIDFIEQNHHEYVKISIPRIRDLLSALDGDTPGLDIPELTHTFDMLTSALLDHLPKEEVVLFPALRRVATGSISAALSPLAQNIQTTIEVLETDHAGIGSILGLLRSQSAHYQAPAGSKPAVRVLLRQLQELDDDIVQHLHLENNILFPRFNSSQPLNRFICN